VLRKHAIGIAKTSNDSISFEAFIPKIGTISAAETTNPKSVGTLNILIKILLTTKTKFSSEAKGE